LHQKIQAVSSKFVALKKPQHLEVWGQTDPRSHAFHSPTGDFRTGHLFGPGPEGVGAFLFE